MGIFNYSLENESNMLIWRRSFPQISRFRIFVCDAVKSKSGFLVPTPRLVLSFGVIPSMVPYFRPANSSIVSNFIVGEGGSFVLHSYFSNLSMVYLFVDILNARPSVSRQLVIQNFSFGGERLPLYLLLSLLRLLILLVVRLLLLSNFVLGSMHECKLYRGICATGPMLI